jgi:hypothetical protein
MTKRTLLQNEVVKPLFSGQLKKHLVSMRRVLESLVAVNDQSGHVFMLFKGFGKGLQNQLVIISKADMVGYKFVVKQVFNGGEIEPRILYTAGEWPPSSRFPHRFYISVLFLLALKMHPFIFIG